MTRHALRQLLPRLLVFGFVLVGLDQGIGRTFDRLYRGSSRDVLLGTRDRPPVIVLGSSRAHRQYDPEVLGAKLGTSVWNFGQDGQFGPAYQYGLLQLILREYTPRLVVLDVGAPLFYSGPDDYDRLDVLAPYATQSAGVHALLRRRSRWERVKLWSRVYPYNSRILEVINQGRRKALAGRTRGFDPATGRISPALLAQGEPVLVGTQRVADSARASVNRIDPRKLEDITAIRDLLRQHGVKVVAVRSPTLLRSQWASERDTRQEGELRRLFAGLEIPFIDFSTRVHPNLGETSLYFDWVHLNGEGARQFSAMIADTLRTYLH